MSTFAYRPSAIGYRYCMRARNCRSGLLWLLVVLLAPLVDPALVLAQAPARRAETRMIAPSLRQRMLAEEDARSTTPLAILQALKGDNADLRRIGVRALGRLEQPEVSAALVHFLADPEASVRVEAANALAQSVFATTDASAVTNVGQQLRDRLRVETHPLVRGALALSLARLHHPSDAAGREATNVVFDVAFPKSADDARAAASPAVLVNALRGLLHAALARGLSGSVTHAPGDVPVTWLSDEARATLATFIVSNLECRAGEQPPQPEVSENKGAAGSASQQVLRPCPPAGQALPPTTNTPADVRNRRQALEALVATRMPGPVQALALLWEPDEQMRALAVRWALEVSWEKNEDRDRVIQEWARRFGGSSTTARAEVTARARVAAQLASVDPSLLVRYEAVRALTKNASNASDCAMVLRAMDDTSLAIATHAIENAYLACGVDSQVVARLDVLTQSEPPPAAIPLSAAYSTSALPAASVEARRYAAALIGYARVAPVAARSRVLDALNSRVALVRRDAVTAAGYILQWARATGTADETLRAAIALLVDDGEMNVATEAVHVLTSQAREASRAVFLRALRRDDEALVLEAAQALRRADRVKQGAEAGSDVSGRAVDLEIAGAALDALTRLTAAKRETSRDPRLALLALAKDSGDLTIASRLDPWLEDFDPVVASAAAEAIGVLRTTSSVSSPSASSDGAPAAERPRATPNPPPHLPLPTDADLARMATVRVALIVKGRGTLVIRLRPDEAPLNAFRFLRLAEQGYYTGLTFHRLVSNFVVQGGSPHANEYTGDASFSRDEVGLLSNLRGSVGLSTRGRDTGDAQFYVNLVDNVRLDHTYTVFAQVETGMDVVDALVEGDVIERVEIL